MGTEVAVNPVGYDDANKDEPLAIPGTVGSIRVATPQEVRHMMTDGNNLFRRLLRKCIGSKIFLYEEKYDSVYDSDLLKRKTAYLRGYWQSERYFSGIKDVVRSGIQFPALKGRYADYERVIRTSSSAVSIHIRRGDYLKAAGMYGDLAGSGYYDRAVEKIRELTAASGQELHFFIFSNDIDWCRKNLGFLDNPVFIEGDDTADPCDDMHLMSLCKHNIIANSSFSWWGAWLNVNEDKIVIAPKEWLIGKTTPDIWCEGWIKV